MSELEFTVRVALFCLVPLALTGIIILLTRIGVRKGWLIRRKEPTEYDLALQRLRDEMAKTTEEIGRALLPVVQKLADAMGAIFPPRPPTFRERLRRWFRA